jgi:ELWxxDGT repeat protein
MLIVAILGRAALLSGAESVCGGDCDGDRRVGIAELVGAVDGAAGGAAPACPAADADRNGRLTIDELIRSVGEALGGCGAAQQPAYLVRDIDDGTAIVDSIPSDFTTVGDVAFFIATTAVTGAELWKSDGTGAGTGLVKDVVPGADGAGFHDLIAFGDRLLLARGLSEIWESDGSAEGTRPIVTTRLVVELTAAGATAVFNGADDTHGSELWATDGSADGTRLLADLLPGSASGVPRPAGRLGGRVLLTANDLSGGRVLWVSDGTPDGTRALAELGLGIDPPIRLLGTVDGEVFLSGAHGRSLWASDLTPAGTRLVLDLADTPFSRLAPLSGVAAAGDRLLFQVEAGNQGARMVLSDGTADGSRVLGGPQPGAVVSTGELAFFTAETTASRARALWRCDGTDDGTFAIPLGDAACPGSATPLAAVAGHAFLVGSDCRSGAEPWTSDGTAAGTHPLADLNPGPNGSQPADVTPLGDRLLFRATSEAIGSELWSSDGTVDGTGLVANIAHDVASSAPAFLTDLNGVLLFVAGRASDGGGLWRSDGTATGTALVPGGPSDRQYSLATLTVVGERLFFIGPDDGQGAALWTSDARGARLVKDTCPDATGRCTLSIVRDTLTAVGDRLYFVGNDGVVGPELWVSDGSPEGTQLVKDVRPGWQRSPGLGELTAAGATLFFAAGVGDEAALWRSDGSEAGTVPLAGLEARELTAVGDTLFFAVGGTLWRSDGTVAGTLPVRDLGGPSGALTELVAAAGQLFFFAAAGGGEALWRSDGTTAGTVRVRAVPGDPDPFLSGTFPAHHPQAAAGRLFFVVDDPAHGRELWSSDGTATGTGLVRDIHRGPAAAQPTELADAGGRLVFTACDANAGCEPWSSDGTAAGTRRLADVLPGPLSSNPRDYTVAGERLYFSADDPMTGRELWALPLDALPPGPATITGRR